jgi:hypothetical protein
MLEFTYDASLVEKPYMPLISARDIQIEGLYGYLTLQTRVLGKVDDALSPSSQFSYYSEAVDSRWNCHVNQEPLDPTCTTRAEALCSKVVSRNEELEDLRLAACRRMTTKGAKKTPEDTKKVKTNQKPGFEALFLCCLHVASCLSWLLSEKNLKTV